MPSVACFKDACWRSDAVEQLPNGTYLDDLFVQRSLHRSSIVNVYLRDFFCHLEYLMAKAQVYA